MNYKLKLLNEVLNVDPKSRAFIVENPDAVDILKMQADGVETYPAMQGAIEKTETYSKIPGSATFDPMNWQTPGTYRIPRRTGLSDSVGERLKHYGITGQIQKTFDGIVPGMDGIAIRNPYPVEVSKTVQLPEKPVDVMLLPEPLASDRYFNQHTLPYMNPGKEVLFLSDIEGIKFDKNNREIEKTWDVLVKMQELGPTGLTPEELRIWQTEFGDFAV